jgi:S-adenosylmethionine:tRNA-ribosyltransferase-isomerase (queuine synthetase)
MGPVGNINSIAVVGLVPKVMSSFMVSKAYSKNIKGRDISKLCDAISNGICIVLQGMILSGTAAGIAIGGGTGSFTAVNASALSKLMLLNMQSKKINGRDIAKICDCISFGIANHLKTSVKFTTMVTGAIAPTPPTGPIAVMGIPSIFTKIA